MGRLNQTIAVVQGKKARAQRLLTDAHQGWNREAISGITKTYRPKVEGDDVLPSENKQIHLDVPSKVRETMQQVESFFDVVATQEGGNTKACATIMLNSKAMLVDVPVTILLFLERQLVDLRTFISQLPTLPPDRQWSWDGNKGCYVTAPVDSLRTQKRAKPIVKYAATKEHPAQTELITEDVVAGTWTTTHMSSAIPVQEREGMLRRIEALQDAVKIGREQANSMEVEAMAIGRELLVYIFGDLLKIGDRAQS